MCMIRTKCHISKHSSHIFSFKCVCVCVFWYQILNMTAVICSNECQNLVTSLVACGRCSQEKYHFQFCYNIWCWYLYAYTYYIYVCMYVWLVFALRVQHSLLPFSNAYKNMDMDVPVCLSVRLLVGLHPPTFRAVASGVIISFMIFSCFPHRLSLLSSCFLCVNYFFSAIPSAQFFHATVPATNWFLLPTCCSVSASLPSLGPLLTAFVLSHCARERRAQRVLQTVEMRKWTSEKWKVFERSESFVLTQA